jgi:predicted O-methyltransferase YrrM
VNDTDIQDIPTVYPLIKAKQQQTGFSMPSDLYIGTLLKTLTASKPGGNVLELGTGIGLSLAWMIDGLSNDSSLISIDNDPELISIANELFGEIENVEVICADGSEWIKSYSGDKFDLIFADAWPGKYSELKETLNLLKVGGFYVIDDMAQQPNWPDGHDENVRQLVAYLETRSDFSLTKLNWSTGVILMTKKN